MRNKRPKWIIDEKKWEQWYDDVGRYNVVATDNVDDEIKNFTDSLDEPATNIF